MIIRTNAIKRLLQAMHGPLVQRTMQYAKPDNSCIFDMMGQLAKNKNIYSQDVVDNAIFAHALNLWRNSKRVYRIDTDLCTTLFDLDISNYNFTISNISELNGVCVEMPFVVKAKRYTGFIINTSPGSTKELGDNLSFIMVPDTNFSSMIKSCEMESFGIVHGMTLEKCMRRVYNDGAGIPDHLKKFVLIVAYLLSGNADIEQDPENVESYRPMDPNRIVDKYREVQIFNVGVNEAVRYKQLTEEYNRLIEAGNTSTRITSGHFVELFDGSVTDNGGRSVKILWMPPALISPESIDDHSSESCDECTSIKNNDETQCVDTLLHEVERLNRLLEEKDSTIFNLERTNSKLKKQYDSLIAEFDCYKEEATALRSIIYNYENGMYCDNESDDANSDIAPYYTDKKVTVFGGYPSWVNGIKNLLPNVRFVDKNSYSVNSNIIKTSDVIWLQTNAMSHSLYDGIMNVARKYNKLVKYFKYAGTKKCAMQFIEEMSK